MKRRLYLQIWGAFVLVAFACLLVAAAAARVNWDGERRPFPTHARGLVVLLGEQLPPPGASEGELRASVDQLGRRFDLAVGVWGPDLTPLAFSRHPLPPPRPDGPPIQWLPRGGVAARLEDGRWIGGDLRPDHGEFPRFVLTLGAVFGTIALGAYPIARRITRRLEALRAAVDAWGNGRFTARAPVEGEDEVAAVARSFNAAAGRVQRLVDGQRQALASASHELRSPLARVRMAVALLEDGDPSRRPIVADAERDIAELDALIGDLLLAARLDDERPLEREPVDLLVLAAEEAARTGAAVEGASKMIEGDPKLLRRLLRNLLENARRYSDTVEAHVGVDAVEIRDRGPGVPDVDRERIFEPFYRPTGHREGHGGVGLGLSLVRSIAARHGGRVVCLPREGGGTVFRVELPAR